MDHAEYKKRLRLLRSILNDALERGDYHLEMDTKELIEKLMDKFEKE